MGVDYKSMGMPGRRMAMWMTVRLGSFPALMLMRMMLVMNVQVIMLKRPVCMRDLRRIDARPERQRERGGNQDHRNHRRKGGRQAERRAEPARGRIGEKPAGVR